MEEMRNAYELEIGKPERKETLACLSVDGTLF
jgi:hypothetical protein